MRNVSERFLEAVLGSNSPVVTADVWRGGDVIRTGTQVAGGKLDFTSSQTVEGSLSLMLVDDPDGEPVDAFGCRVNVRAGFDLEGSIETVSMGWYEIQECTSDDAWSWFDWRADAVKTSSVLQLQGVDLMATVAESDFLTPQQPTAGADAWATIANLCTGIVSVIDPGFAPMTIPAGLVFTYSRIDAITAIAQLWNAAPVMTPDGQLTLATEDGGDIVPSFGARINVDWWQKQSASRDLKNGVTFIGKAPDGSELVGYATEQSGKLRWGGEFGYRPQHQSSDLMTTQAMVDEAAQTALQRMIARRSVTQTVSALWNPAVELRDRPSLVLPDSIVDSTVIGYSLPLTGGPMSVTLRLPMISPFNPPPDWRPVPVPLPVTPYPDTFYPDTTFPA